MKVRSSVKNINSLRNKLSVNQPESFEYFYFAFERFSIKNLKDLNVHFSNGYENQRQLKTRKTNDDRRKPSKTPQD